MKRRLCLVLLLLWGGGAAAQTLQIRSGEHDGFTRLVIDMAPDTRWSLASGAGGYDRVVKFPGETFSFDTTGVFGRITTSRLSGLGAVAGTSDLGLKLSCKCGVEAFVLNQRMLVVDISEEFAAEPQPTKPQSRDIGVSASGDLPFLPQTQAPMTETLGVLPLDRLATWSGGEWSNSAPSRSPVPDPLRAEIAGVERNITEQLALAVTSGVLDVSKVPGAPPEALTSNKPAPDGPLGDQVPPPADIPRVDAPRATLEDGRILLSGDNCIAEEDLALRDWAGDGPFDTQLRDLRQGLVGEFDRVDAAVAEKLAKFYLHHGMGPEAEVFIDLASTPARPTLSALAALLDEKPDTTDTFSA